MTPGWSPSTSVKTTPALSALALRSGPSVPSSSGFIRSVCLPCSTAASTGAMRVLDRAGHLEHHVDMRAGRHQHRVLGDRGAAGLDGARRAPARCRRSPRPPQPAAA